MACFCVDEKKTSKITISIRCVRSHRDIHEACHTAKWMDGWLLPFKLLDHVKYTHTHKHTNDDDVGDGNVY